MPIKDPEKRRDYDKNYKRNTRSADKLGLIAKKSPAKGRRKTPGSPADPSAQPPLAAPALAGEGLGFDPLTWETEKGRIGWALVAKARSALASLKHEEMTPKETMDFLSLGCKLVETSLASLKDELSALEGLDWEALLSNPDAMEHVIALLPYVTQQPTEAVAVDTAKDRGAKQLRNPRNRENVEEVRSPGRPGKGPAARPARKNKAAAGLDATPARKEHPL